MKRAKKKVAARVLAVMLTLSCGMGTLVCAGEGGGPAAPADAVVVGFSTPAQAATVALGTSRPGLPLPETLAAKLDGGGEPADVPVSWTDDDSHGGYTLTVMFEYGSLQSSGEAQFTLTRPETGTPAPGGHHPRRAPNRQRQQHGAVAVGAYLRIGAGGPCRVAACKTARKDGEMM